MRAVAREAGVGIATLYRHFPTRESLVDAVYQDQVKRLILGARELLEQLPPAEAMRRWMDLFADWLATKHGMTDTLLAMIESGEIAYAVLRCPAVCRCGPGRRGLVSGAHKEASCLACDLYRKVSSLA
jgi:AcrR family transcriptional regulator